MRQVDLYDFNMIRVLVDLCKVKDINVKTEVISTTAVLLRTTKYKHALTQIANAMQAILALPISYTSDEQELLSGLYILCMTNSEDCMVATRQHLEKVLALPPMSG